MIVAERKPFEEIKTLIKKGYDKILVVWCGACVAVCLVGRKKRVSRPPGSAWSGDWKALNL